MSKMHILEYEPPTEGALPEHATLGLSCRSPGGRQPARTKPFVDIKAANTFRCVHITLLPREGAAGILLPMYRAAIERGYCKEPLLTGSPGEHRRVLNDTVTQ